MDNLQQLLQQEKLLKLDLEEITQKLNTLSKLIVIQREMIAVKASVEASTMAEKPKDESLKNQTATLSHILSDKNKEAVALLKSKMLVSRETSPSDKSQAIPVANGSGKELSNPLMADILPIDDKDPMGMVNLRPSYLTIATKEKTSKILCYLRRPSQRHLR